MAIVFSGDKRPQEELQEIQRELYSDWGTFVENKLDIQEGFKSGAEVYESKVTVNMQDYDSGEITAGSDEFKVERSTVQLNKFMFKDQVDYNILLDTRFERTMKAGAFNTVSSEFDNKVLQQIKPAISQTMENEIWGGVTSATQTAVAALTPGTTQGTISSATQTKIAGLTSAGKFDGILARIVYNDSQSKDTPGAGLGDYRRVLTASGSISESNIASEYQKLYNDIDPLVINKGKVEIVAPLSHRAFMVTANNSIGASSNKNFDIQGNPSNGKVFYNGIEISFKPIPEDTMIACDPYYIKILMDLKGDMSALETGEVANGADKMWYKNVQSVATWVTNQKYIYLYSA